MKKYIGPGEHELTDEEKIEILLAIQDASDEECGCERDGEEEGSNYFL